MKRSPFSLSIQSVQFSRSVVSESLTPWTAARQAPLSITNSRSLLRLLSVESVMPSNHRTLCRPLLLLPPIFPASGSFQMSQIFPSGGQSIGVSAPASVLPMNIYSVNICQITVLQALNILNFFKIYLYNFGCAGSHCIAFL